MIKKILASALIGAITVGLSGCGTPIPEPKQITFTNDNELSKEEKVFILNTTVDKHKGIYPDPYKNDRYFSKNGCIVFTESYSGIKTKTLNHNYNYCFKLSNNAIVTKYYSNNSSSGRSKFTALAEELALNISKYYDTELQNS